LLSFLAVASDEEAPEKEGTIKVPIEDFFKATERPPPPEERYQRSVVAAARQCQAGGRSISECWSRATPAKCESLVYPALAERGDKLRA
jgi:hypothetical protein